MALSSGMKGKRPTTLSSIRAMLLTLGILMLAAMALWSWTDHYKRNFQLDMARLTQEIQREIIKNATKQLESLQKPEEAETNNSDEEETLDQIKSQKDDSNIKPEPEESESKDNQEEDKPQKEYKEKIEGDGEDLQESANAISPFRRQYLLWDLHNPIAMYDTPARRGKGYLIYRCNSICGGWADRLKGAMFAYIAANLTGRQYKAQFLRPKCDMSTLFVPNRVNWTIADDIRPNHTNMEMNSMLGNGGFKERVEKANFSEMFDPSKEFTFTIANMDYLSNLMKSKVYKQEVAWMQGLTPADVYGTIYRRLFKLSTPLQLKLEQLLYEALPTPQHRLVCIQVRLGHEAFEKDWARRNSLANLPKIWEFINGQTKSDLDKVFVMSDSDTVIASAKNQSWAHRLVLVPGEIIHVDKFPGRTNIEACTGFAKLLVEHHVLMNCDVFVRGHSGLSVIASQVRGTDKGLYCLHGDGNIVPCQRNNFTTFL